MRQVVWYPGDDGYWVAECPSLMGCVSQGATRHDAIANIKEAIEEYIGVLEDENGNVLASDRGIQRRDGADRRAELPGGGR